MSDAVPAYEDDATIGPAAQLWRRIPSNHIVPDGNGGRRISSAAFQDHPNGTPMSVVLGDEVLAAKRDPTEVIAGHEGFGLASVTAGLARLLNQGIARRPLPSEPAHAEVFGDKPRSVSRKFAKAASWVIEPNSEVESHPDS